MLTNPYKYIISGKSNYCQSIIRNKKKKQKNQPWTFQICLTRLEQLNAFQIAEFTTLHLPLSDSLYFFSRDFLESLMSWPRERHECGHFCNYFECATCFKPPKLCYALLQPASRISMESSCGWEAPFPFLVGDIKDALELIQENFNPRSTQADAKII